MNYPVQQYPPQPAVYPPAPDPQQYAAPAPPQQYAPQFPGYPPAPQGYPAQVAPQQYAQPAPPQAPQVPLAPGSLDAYYSQPATGGGGGLKFTNTQTNSPLIGQTYLFRVARPVTSGDVQQQTNNQNVPLFFKDGRPKFVLIIPVELLEPSPNHPDGLAKWYVKGGARDELARAMHEAGAPEGPPEAGAIIRVTLTGTRQSGPGMNPAHVFSVQYVRPENAGQPVPAPPTDASSPAPAGQIPVQQAMPGQALPPMPPQAYAQGAQPLPVAQAAPAYQVPQAVAPAAPAPLPAQPAQAQQVAPGAPQPPSNLSPEQQELLIRLRGQQAPQA